MKKIYLLLCFIFIVAWDLGVLESSEEEATRQLVEQTTYEQYKGCLSEIRNAFSIKMEHELSVGCSGFSGILHDKIEMIGMQFHAPRRATIAEARALQLHVMNALVDSINAHKEIQPFLIVKPFPPGLVEISISFAGRGDSYNNGTVDYVFNVPETATVTENIKKIFYCTTDPFIGGLADLHCESYEEAKRINVAFPIKTLATHEVNGEEEIMDLLLKAFEQKIWEEYGISTWSIGCKSNKYLEEIAGKFRICRKASQDESRYLMLNMIDKLLFLVNDNQKLRSHLNGSPFPANQLKIRLSFRDKKDWQFRDGSMESVVFADNELIYYQSPPPEENEKRGVNLDPDPLQVPVYAKESYQEAKEKAAGAPVSLYRFGPTSFFERAYDTFIACLYWVLSIILFFFTYS